MGQTVEAGTAPPAQESGVGSEGNLTLGELAGSFLHANEAADVSDAGDTESGEQATNDSEETVEDSHTDAVSESGEDGDTDPEDSGESEESENEDDDVLSELKPSAANKARKRIDKLTARAKDAEEKLEAEREEFQKRIEALEEKLTRDEKAEQSQSMTFADRVQSADSVAELSQLLETARATRKWARKHINEMEVEVNGQTVDQDQIQQMLDEADDVIEQIIPQRANYLQQRQVVEQNTLKDFPAWADRKHPDHQLYQTIWNDPVSRQTFHKLPNGKYLASVFAEGLKALQAREQPKAGKKGSGEGQEAPATEEAQKPARKQATAPRVPGMDDGFAPPPRNELADLEKRFQGQEQISQEDLVAYFAAQERAKRNQKG